MKKTYWLFVIGLCLLLSLTGCGQKTEEDVLEELNDKITNMTGYKAKAKMTLETGEEPQEYDVEIWHQKDNYYRVALTNKNNNQSQIILRNDDGVFVLTPALNKSFRFQSDWPNNNSQVYLYESLARDILMDAERKFTAKDDRYIFETMTNYQNKNLDRQEIALNKKDLAPLSVKIMNQDLKELVQLNFEKFEWNPSFNKEDFAVERNMTAAHLENIPALSEMEESSSFTPLYPMYEPAGTTFLESKTIQTEEGEKVVITYTGDYHFTLIEQKAKVVPASAPMNLRTGEPVDLGFTVGVLTNDALMWTHDGIDYYLASEDLPEEEMISVARSVYGKLEK